MAQATSFSPLRLFTPIQLAFCMVLFFLPWLDIQCTLPTKGLPKEEVEKIRKEVGIDVSKPVSIVSQSGLQIAIGDFSLSSDFKKLQEKAKKSGREIMSDDAEQKKTKEMLNNAPLLIFYFGLLIAGIVIAFLPLPSIMRRVLLACCCGSAFAAVMLQTVMGFPLEKVLKANEKMRDDLGGKRPGATGPLDIFKGDSKSDPDVIRAPKQISLILSIALALGATGTAFLGGDGTRKRRKPRYEDEYDDDEDEEEERPRKKKRYEEDEDDDDDRPRKKRRRDDDD